MTDPIRRYTRNTHGRDFVVGDIHGCFSLLERLLAAVEFDAGRDRLFSVGDLVDRGPESPRALEFLALPWFHTVRGNHDDFVLSARTRESRLHWWVACGGVWWLEQDEATRARFRQALAQLPLVIEVESVQGLTGIVHADVPATLDWPGFVAALRAGEAEVAHTALWGRARMMGQVRTGVAGIERILVGHTPSFDGVCRVGNVYGLDTGAVYGLLEPHYSGAALSLLELDSGTVYMLPSADPSADRSWVYHQRQLLVRAMLEADKL
ncbi:MAG TPA: metallophosphoesterase [Nevskiales bacterium]|nr:metallophosphoesterase [Nevskiales bacterium]